MAAPKSSAPPAIGIDLGTTMSVVAYLDATGRPATIMNPAGDLLTPSAILCDDAEIIVGKEAIRGSVGAPELFADCFKRDMGKSFYTRQIRGMAVPPEILSAIVLENLKQTAEQKVGPIQQVVITVPAFFDEGRRRATQEAGKLAGLEVLDIINEPTAAAVAYGFQAQQRDDAAAGGNGAAGPKRVLVYDLGGGTFDVTLLEIQGNDFKALATDGDHILGGQDFDERLVNHLAERYLATHRKDPRDDPADKAQLQLDARAVKHALTERQRATATVSHQGVRMRIDVTRTEFEELTADLLLRTEHTTSQLLREKGIEWSAVDRVLLVGGSSRMPMVAAMLKRLSGKEPDRSASPDEAVAQGAALYCAMLQRKLQGAASSSSLDLKLTNVNSHSLGVVGKDPNTMRPMNVVLIKKNTPLPAQKSRSFSTAVADQRSVQIKVVEGESANPDGCVELGQCVLRNLPPGLPAKTPVIVEFSYAANGRLSVSARMKATGVAMRIEIEHGTADRLESLDLWKARLQGQAPPKPLPPGFNPEVARQAGEGAIGMAFTPAGMTPLLPSEPAAAPRAAPLDPPPHKTPAPENGPAGRPIARPAPRPGGPKPAGSRPGPLPMAKPEDEIVELELVEESGPSDAGRRLRELYLVVGRAMAGENTGPAFALWQQRIVAANDAALKSQSALTYAEQALRSAPPGSSIELSLRAQFERARQDLSRCQLGVEESLVDLGRACVDAGLNYARLQRELDEIRALRARGVK